MANKGIMLDLPALFTRLTSIKTIGAAGAVKPQAS
jgi:hypothetical protein